MQQPEKITINEVEYVRADTIRKIEGDMKIVIVDRGFVYIGIVEETSEFITIHDAKSIRRWGTTRGLGELINGPLEETQLDPYGTVRIPMKSVIGVINVDAEKWQ